MDSRRHGGDEEKRDTMTSRTFTTNAVTVTETQRDALCNHDGSDFDGKVLPSHRALVKAGLAYTSAPMSFGTYSFNLTDAGRAWVKVEMGEDDTSELVAEIESLKAQNEMLRELNRLRAENAALAKRVK
jgi:hypothetical protein